MADGGEYENYTKTSKFYDTGRQPIGLDVFLGSIAQLTNGDMKKASLVDIGCGTGNYICALSPYVGQITGVEYNPGMLEQAKAKTSQLQNVKLLQGDGTNIPLPDGYCDIVYSTQVVHHFPMDKGEFTGCKKFIAESYRILKDNGLLIMNICTPEQCEKCWIGAGISPSSGAEVAKRCPSSDLIRSEFKQTGYKLQSFVLHCYPELHVKSEESLEGPLSSEWRALDSGWAPCTGEELERVQREWRVKQEKGTTHEFFEGRREMISRIGETTTIVGRKGQ